jgi:hypothetical protein
VDFIDPEARSYSPLELVLAFLGRCLARLLGALHRTLLTLDGIRSRAIAEIDGFVEGIAKEHAPPDGTHLATLLS